MTDRNGHCLCGAVKFTATGMATEFSTCYCNMCRRWTGGAFTGVSVSTDDLNITGSEHIHIYQSSNFAERASCNKCGSAIWFRLTAGPYVGSTSIALGLLNDVSGLKLKREYFVDYKNNTNDLPEDRIQMTSADIEKIVAEFAKKE
jgi:hypothetical protein